MNNRIFCFIFARGGSKGIPKKNLIKINGISLLGHSIQISKAFQKIERTFVSTDCDEIAKEALNFGAEVILRPKDISKDDSNEWDAWQHGINHAQKKYGTFEIFLSLPTTSPLRNLEDIKKCIEAIETTKANSVISICKSRRSPWFNMVSFQDNKVKLLISGEKVFRRQDSPNCFDITTVAYASKTNFLSKSTSIWDGEVIGVEVPEHRSIDIDTFLDYKIANFLFNDNKLKELNKN